MDILMPQLGETVTEGTITSWFKSVGDSVAVGEALFEIETDKSSMEVESTTAGILSEIRVKAGAVVPVSTVVGVVMGAGEVPSRPSEPPAAPKTAPVARTLSPFNEVRSPERNFGPATLANGVKVTPLARRLATTATWSSTTSVTGCSTGSWCRLRAS